MGQGAIHLRNDNRVRIFKHLLERDGVSQVELSHLTGISAATVTRIIEDFTSCGLVTEEETRLKRVGRSPTALHLRTGFAVQAAVLHEGERLQAGLLDLRGQMLACRRVSPWRDLRGLLLEQLPDLVAGMLAEADVSPRRLAGLGIGLPAALDPQRDFLLDTDILGLSQPADLHPWIETLSAQLEAPVRLENDVNAQALGEFAFRDLAADSDMAFVTLGAGVGCGIILSGKLRRGGRNLAGEIGYMRLPTGTLQESVCRSALEERFGAKALRAPTQEQREALLRYISQALSPCVAGLAIAGDIPLITLGGELTDLLGDALAQRIQADAQPLVPLELQVETARCPHAGLFGLNLTLRQRFLETLRQQGLPFLKKFFM